MKADMPPAIRKRLIVSGNVQEAAYRVLVRSIARSMGITGFVRNLLDETVEIVCEAEPKTLAKFIKSIDRKGDPASPLDLNVVSIQETPAPVEGEFITFKIEYDGILTPEEHERARVAREERMILEAATLKDEIKTVGKAVQGVGQKVDGVGKDVQVVGQKVDSMHSDMNTRFDHMAQRYDLIARSIVKAIDRLDRGFERMDKDSKRTDRAMERSRKEAAASNRELAKAVRFMITKLSKKAPAPRKARQMKRRNRR
jgi:acylphosphatase